MYNVDGETGMVLTRDINPIRLSHVHTYTVMYMYVGYICIYRIYVVGSTSLNAYIVICTYPYYVLLVVVPVATCKVLNFEVRIAVHRNFFKWQTCCDFSGKRVAYQVPGP